MAQVIDDRGVQVALQFRFIIQRQWCMQPVHNQSVPNTDAAIAAGTMQGPGRVNGGVSKGHWAGNTRLVHGQPLRRRMGWLGLQQQAMVMTAREELQWAIAFVDWLQW